MLQQILMFERQSVCYDTMNIFTKKLASCLEQRGISVDYLDLDSPHLQQEVLKLTKVHYDAAVAFNSLGQEAFRANGQYLFDYLDIPFFNYIVDHPLRHHHTLSTPLKNYHVLCLDEDHITYINKYYPHIKSVHVLPLGGMPAAHVNKHTREDFHSRKYDLILTGSYYSLHKLEEQIMQMPELERELSVRLIEQMLQNRSLTNEEALENVFRDLQIENVELSVFADLMAGTNLAGHYVNAYVREEIVRQLISSEIELHIFGNGWEAFSTKDLGRTTIHSGITYMQSADLAQNSKMVLNTMPWFKSGLHDRIPTAMLNGAVSVTDDSRYIKQYFQNNKDLLVYQLDNLQRLPEIVCSYLEDEERLYDIARAGERKAAELCTWQRRTGELIKIMESEK